MGSRWICGGFAGRRVVQMKRERPFRSALTAKRSLATTLKEISDPSDCAPGRSPHPHEYRRTLDCSETLGNLRVACS